MASTHVVTTEFHRAGSVIPGPSSDAGGPAFSYHSSSYIPDTGYVRLNIAMS